MNRNKFLNLIGSTVIIEGVEYRVSHYDKERGNGGNYHVTLVDKPGDIFIAEYTLSPEVVDLGNPQELVKISKRKDEEAN